LDENLVVNLIGNNLKQVSNYYKMIIDNLYSHFYLKKSSKKNYTDAKYKFPQCLQLDIDNLDYYEKLNIISLFFFDAYNRLLNNHNFEDMKYFFDSFLQRIKFNQIKDNKKPKSKSKNKQNKLLSSSSTTKDIKNVVVYKYNYNNGFYYLPPMKKYYKYTLVLDLDETLIYLMPNNIYLTEDGKIGETRHSLIFRPGLIEFLKKMKSIYELIIFSFGTLEYVDSVIKIIEKNEKFFEHVLYRQHATINNGEYIKDLSLLGRNLKNILIVDDISQVFKLQERNGICIKAFYGDIVGDRNTLKILGKILEKVRFDADEDGDIRKSLEKQKNIILTNITNNSD
jgi:Dullard-like phosphatase family protein